MVADAEEIIVEVRMSPWKLTLLCGNVRQLTVSHRGGHRKHGPLKTTTPAKSKLLSRLDSQVINRHMQPKKQAIVHQSQ